MHVWIHRPPCTDRSAATTWGLRYVINVTKMKLYVLQLHIRRDTGDCGIILRKADGSGPGTGLSSDGGSHFEEVAWYETIKLQCPCMLVQTQLYLQLQQVPWISFTFSHRRCHLFIFRINHHQLIPLLLLLAIRYLHW